MYKFQQVFLAGVLCAASLQTSAAPQVLQFQALDFSKMQEEQLTQCHTENNDAAVLSFAWADSKNPITLRASFQPWAITKDEQVLLLLVGRCLTDTPDLETPLSQHKLALLQKDMELMAVYPLSAMTPAKQGRLGRMAGIATQMQFELHLDRQRLAEEAVAGNQKLYMQAAIMDKKDYFNKHYSHAYLSMPMTLYLNGQSCAENMSKAENKVCEHITSPSQK
ncbi:hypothetical protein [Candidatus Venteria ishoeyi]|uniref:Uncharacterized protein n=1 Tax=Candidatus Venteria ishoeyi TaxID=1899563 RepID=A0A1H6F7T8_9GAMM|nr:hypothetical protein [Candidatus Venteria ishoeyi]SEH05025.1 Uncharacterised protein [Candidatus Venteria ishoeyi]